jgi:hypothetical protein
LGSRPNTFQRMLQDRVVVAAEILAFMGRSATMSSVGSASSTTSRREKFGRRCSGALPSDDQYQPPGTPGAAIVQLGPGLAGDSSAHGRLDLRFDNHVGYSNDSTRWRRRARNVRSGG